jgi:signal transduction histidine kinase
MLMIREPAASMDFALVAPRAGDVSSASALLAADPAEQIRQALARELHDSVAQTLSLMLVDLELFKVEQGGSDGVLRMLSALQESTRSVLDDIRRVLYDLRGVGTVMDFGLSLRALATATQIRTGIEVKVTVAKGWPAEIPVADGVNLFRIVEEAITNAIRHGRATRIGISLRGARSSPDQVELSVRDNGAGVASPDGRMRPGLGITGMYERAALTGAQLEFQSSRSGTSVRVILNRAKLAA